MVAWAFDTDCSQVTATEPYLWEVNIGSGTVLVPSGSVNLDLSPYGVTRPQWVDRSMFSGLPLCSPAVLDPNLLVFLLCVCGHMYWQI